MVHVFERSVVGLSDGHRPAPSKGAPVGLRVAGGPVGPIVWPIGRCLRQKTSGWSPWHSIHWCLNSQVAEWHLPLFQSLHIGIRGWLGAFLGFSVLSPAFLQSWDLWSMLRQWWQYSLATAPLNAIVHKDGLISDHLTKFSAAACLRKFVS